MIKTGIILKVEDNFPVWHKNEGFAKSFEVAEWIFKYCGWATESRFPSLAHCVAIENWPNGNVYFPGSAIEHWVLGERIILN